MSLFEGTVIVLVVIAFSLFFVFMILGYRISHSIEELTAKEATKLLAEIDDSMKK